MLLLLAVLVPLTIIIFEPFRPTSERDEFQCFEYNAIITIVSSTALLAMFFIGQACLSEYETTKTTRYPIVEVKEYQDKATTYTKVFYENEGIQSVTIPTQDLEYHREKNEVTFTTQTLKDSKLNFLFLLNGEKTTITVNYS